MSNLWRDSLLPPNRTRLEAALSVATATKVDPAPLRTILRAETCPANFLPWLAWERHVEGWELATTEAERRALVKSSIELHRYNGTPWAVETALAKIGYPDTEIIEYRDYVAKWAAAGGRVLDGTWSLDGSAVLQPPGGGDVRHLALNHWAEYALRLNVGAGAWTAAQQRAIRSMAQSHAPIRSHLKGLLAYASLSFDANVRMVGCRLRIRTRFDNCSRLTAHHWRTLDGCWQLDGGYTPSLLDGSWSLAFGRHLTGVAATGEPLDSGFATFTARMRSRFLIAAAGGGRVTAPVPLVPTPVLDGSIRLNGRHLDGSWPLDGSGALDYPAFSTLGLRRLDGTWHLGCVPGRAGVWFSAVATIRRGGVVHREVL